MATCNFFLVEREVNQQPETSQQSETKKLPEAEQKAESDQKGDPKQKAEFNSILFCTNFTIVHWIILNLRFEIMV